MPTEGKNAQAGGSSKAAVILRTSVAAGGGTLTGVNAAAVPVPTGCAVKAGRWKQKIVPELEPSP